MKTSELIVKLGHLLVQHGDLEVKLPDTGPTSFADEDAASRYMEEHDPVEDVSLSGWKDSAIDTRFFLLE